MSQWTATWNLSFLSTLSLRRATVGVAQGADTGHISIHALLAESDISCSRALLPAPLFLSTLSLRRATALRSPRIALIVGFLSTLSLRRATRYFTYFIGRLLISIHALLAESDCFGRIMIALSGYFYPRSPCGERHLGAGKSCDVRRISIHALLAESDTWARGSRVTYVEFLSTLSLRRATSSVNTADQEARISIHALLAESDHGAFGLQAHQGHFYPRSPCGERHANRYYVGLHLDFYPRSPCGERPLAKVRHCEGYIFLSTLSLRRATGVQDHGGSLMIFLSTLSLRRATGPWSTLPTGTANFYPRSPCGERPHSIGCRGHPRQFLSTLSLRRATHRGCGPGFGI